MADRGSYFVTTLHGNDTTGHKRKDREREEDRERKGEKKIN